MTDLSDAAKLVYKAKHKIRFVTAASLFDGHDAAINIIRRTLQGMMNDMLARCDFDLAQYAPKALEPGNARSLAQLITAIELGAFAGKLEAKQAPVLGVTGTGGAGKSSLTDELVRRFRLDQGPDLGIAVLSVDPTRRKTGGALLGDRIRMNAIHGGRTFMRSLATRETGRELSAAIGGALAACKAAGYRWARGHTAGFGQGGAAIAKHADISLYPITPEF